MKKFIVKISTILITFILPILIGEVIIRSYENEYSYKHRYVCENGDKIETLILGSSRAYYSISPLHLAPNSFIMANAGQVLKMDMEILNQYDRNLPNLKTVIIELSYFSFRSGTVEDMNKPNRYTNYQVFMHFNGGDYCSFYNNFILSNPVLYKGMLKRIKKGEIMKCDSLGQYKYFAHNYSKINLDDNGKKMAMGQTNTNVKVAALNRKYLQDIILYCKRRSIRLVFYTAPVWSTYYENMGQEQYNEMQSIIAEFVGNYNLEYYNYMNDSRFTSDDFVDAHHMSKIGAEKLSRILADTLGM
ncbi:MAG: hypothetical protein SNH80_00235 [Rikenellaceae bacterium]